MTDITELTSVQKNANIHRLSRLIAYASNDELRQMAVEVEIYTDRLIEALEKAKGMEDYWKTQCRGITDHCEELQARIAELESRTVKLPQRLQPGADGYDDWYVHSDDDGEYLKVDDVLAMLTAAGIKVEADSLDADVNDRNQPGMVVAVHIDVGDFVKFRGQVYEVKETDFDDHDVTLWFVCGEVLKCAAGCPIEVVSAPGEDE